MRQVLMLAGAAWLEGRSLPGFETRPVTSPAELMAIVDREPTACVLLLEPEACLKAQQLEAIRQACRRRAVALVVASTNLFHAPHDFDGALDPSWSDVAIARYLDAAIDRLQTRQLLTDLERLTQAMNRTDVQPLPSLDQLFALEHERCGRRAEPYSFVCFDLDRMVDINAAHGKATAERVLAHVHTAVAALTRRSDHAFRFGPDEFVCLLVGANLSDATRYGDRVLRAVRSCAVAAGATQVRVTVSAGVASFPEHGLSFREVLDRATAALGNAKSAGRDRLVCYTR